MVFRTLYRDLLYSELCGGKKDLLKPASNIMSRYFELRTALKVNENRVIKIWINIVLKTDLVLQTTNCIT